MPGFRTPVPRRRLFALGAVLIATTSLAGACGTSDAAEAQPAAQQVKELRYQGQVNAVTLPELAADLGYLGDVRLKWVGNTTSGPQDIQSAATGQTEFGGAFDGAIVKLEQAGAPIKSVISYYGADEKVFQGYFVLADSPIRTARDLIGKKVGVNTLGAHFEAVLDSYLRRNGLSQKEIDSVELVVIPPVNAEQALRAKQIDVAVLGGVLQDTAVEHGGVRLLFSDQQQFGSFNGGSYVFTRDFITRNPDTVRTFVSGTAKAIEWTRTTPREEVIARFEKILTTRGRNENTANLRFWKSASVPSKGGLIVPEDFTRWYDWLSHEGQLDASKVDTAALFTNEFNPYAGGTS
ncbi:MAG: transporter substrate-binding protein [Frankiales bacterium]|nr:transporter substrate-binding protein [Frankiales bacterium]